MTVEFTEIAYREFQDAIEYYEIQERGLGTQFKVEIDKSLRHIIDFPKTWQKETESTRRFLLKRFPYKIIYHLQGDTIIIIAIAHTHRKPDYWIERFQ